MTEQHPFRRPLALITGNSFANACHLQPWAFKLKRKESRPWLFSLEWRDRLM